jgi:adenylate cyclase
MKLIILDEKSEERVYSIDKPFTTLGRNINNDIVLINPSISRNHAIFTLKDDGFYVKDNSSKNGVIINNKKISEVKLNNNDKIKIGTYSITIKEEPGKKSDFQIAKDETVFHESPKTNDEQVVVSESQEISAESQFLIKSVQEVDTDTRRNVYDLTQMSHLPAEQLALLEKRTKMLMTLTSMSEALIASKSLQEILETVMDLVFDTVKAQRGFIMLLDEATGKLDTKIVKFSDDNIEDSKKITISKTIADLVIKQKAGILTSDAAIDPRFKAGESIRIYGIRSAMCVPLWNREKIVGILYVDSLMSKSQFTSDDLDLLASLANHAAVGIEHARLNEEIQKEQKIRQKLERYHSPEVVNIIIAKKEENLDMVSSKVTMLWMDIVGFTPFCEKYEPQIVRLMLNEYFEIMTDIIFDFRGTLDKYLGDGLFALFGAPISQENDAERAILTALEMKKALATLNESRQADMRFRIRTGINTGNVLAGDIGSLRRMDYTVLGDPVNTTQRITIHAIPDQILISESTYLEVKDKFNMRKLDKISVKGKTNLVPVYELST